MNGLIVYRFDKIRKPTVVIVPNKQEQEQIEIEIDRIYNVNKNTEYGAEGYIIAGLLFFGTIVEDFLTGGFGVADAAACFAAALAIIEAIS